MVVDNLAVTKKRLERVSSMLDRNHELFLFIIMVSVLKSGRTW